MAVPKPPRRHGAIAQLVEHLHGMQGVRSSSLLGSIFRIPFSDWGFLCLELVVQRCDSTSWCDFWCESCIEAEWV